MKLYEVVRKTIYLIGGGVLLLLLWYFLELPKDIPQYKGTSDHRKGYLPIEQVSWAFFSMGILLLLIGMGGVVRIVLEIVGIRYKSNSSKIH